MLVEYLVEAVMAREAPAIVEFLERSAVLDLMNGPLLDELLETEGSARLSSSISLAEGFAESGPLSDGSPSIAIAVATLRAFAGWDGVDGVLHNASIVRREGPAGSPWYGVATLLTGTAHSMRGDLDLARERIWEAIRISGEAPALSASAHAHAALIAFYDGDVVDADRLISQAVEMMVDNSLERILPTVQVYPIAALVWTRVGRISDARRPSPRA